ncbi:MAG: DNA recombination protein RmuC [Lentisphaerae bacterium]|nr:DNA recombination protein RmuC [Lentisphaerota bacterium]
MFEWIELILLIVIAGFSVAAFLAVRKKKNPQDDTLKDELKRIENACNEGFLRSRQELGENLAAGRTEQGGNFRIFTESNTKLLTEFGQNLSEESRKNRQETLAMLERIQQSNNLRFAEIRETMDKKIQEIRDQNAEKLEEMRRTVDEKLQKSVQSHFQESFKLIGERLELVQKGLGEMQSLASGVGDLKKVLSNVKTRGNIGEIQLAAILEQYLAADQYLTNVSTVPGKLDLVEFAIRLPGKKDDEPVLLPVDSKFPVEDYQRLLEAYEEYPKMSAELKKAQTAFESAVKKCAKTIREKYVNPPLTTDFALMFVPSEGIYAEILRLPGLVEFLQNTYHISVVGPSNLVAFLNSLQMGFRTLAIEKRSHEVWTILSGVKTQFQKFGDEVDSTKKSLIAAMNHIEKLGTRSRALERELREVHELPSDAAQPAILDDKIFTEGD